MVSEVPTRADFEELQRYYLEAVASLPKIKEGDGGPIYPYPIQYLFGYIRMSVWFSGTLHKIQFGNRSWDEVLINASFEDIGNLLHDISRAEHWDPGAWEEHLKGGSMKLIVDRANVLTSSSNQLTSG